MCAVEMQGKMDLERLDEMKEAASQRSSGYPPLEPRPLLQLLHLLPGTSSSGFSSERRCRQLSGTSKSQVSKVCQTFLGLLLGGTPDDRGTVS